MPQPLDDPGNALSAVAENAMALARAELRLAASEAKSWLIRIGLGLGLLWLAALLTQVLVLLLAVSPILLAVRPWPSVVLMLGLSLLPTAAAFLFAWRELRSVKNLPPAAEIEVARPNPTSETKRVGA